MSKRATSSNLELDVIDEVVTKKNTRSRKTKSSSQKNTTQKPHKEHKFSPLVLLNFFNNYFRNIDPDAKTQYYNFQNIVFKRFSEKQNDEKHINIIDLNDYEGLKHFVIIRKMF